MPQVGDRVIVAGQKLGAPTREGTLLAKLGSMIRVRWADGTESLFTPGAGSVEYQPQARKKAAGKTGSNGKAVSNGKAGKTTAKGAKPAGRSAAKSSKAAGAKGKVTDKKASKASAKTAKTNGKTKRSR